MIKQPAASNGSSKGLTSHLGVHNSELCSIGVCGGGGGWGSGNGIAGVDVAVGAASDDMHTVLQTCALTWGLILENGTGK
jgi:hypothetical protein